MGLWDELDSESDEQAAAPPLPSTPPQAAPAPAPTAGSSSTAKMSIAARMGLVPPSQRHVLAAVQPALQAPPPSLAPTPAPAPAPIDTPAELVFSLDEILAGQQKRSLEAAGYMGPAKAAVCVSGPGPPRPSGSDGEEEANLTEEEGEEENEAEEHVAADEIDEVDDDADADVCWPKLIANACSPRVAVDLGARPRPVDGSVYSDAAYLNANVNQFLRGYQREGVQWMWKQYAADKGGVLGDEMGLGKVPTANRSLRRVVAPAGRPPPIHLPPARPARPRASALSDRRPVFDPRRPYKSLASSLRYSIRARRATTATGASRSQMPTAVRRS